jgi:hypothetical protein
MQANEPSAVATLGVAGLFAAIFLFGGRALLRFGQAGRRRFFSFAAGVSVAYTFVHVLPGLHAIREYQATSPAGIRPLFPEYSVYLWTLLGFLVYYGLETVMARSRQGPGKRADGGHAPPRAWVHLGGFALYTWILTYMMVWTGKGALALVLFAAAMGLHLSTIAGGLRNHHGTLYERRGAYLLALASVGGWTAAMTLDIPIPVVLALVAFVCGGVVVNASIAELPKENEGRYWYFVAGAVAYTALLMVLFHFEEG